MALFTAAVRKEICMEQSVTQLKTLQVLHPLAALRALPSCPLLLHISCLHILDLQHTVKSQTRPWIESSCFFYFIIFNNTSLSLSDHCNSDPKHERPEDNVGCLCARRERFSYLLHICTSIVHFKFSWQYEELV